MNQVRIVVDSTADLLPHQRSRVETVPLTVHFGGQEYVDGVTIRAEEFYRKLETCKDLPKTSQAAPFDFEKVFQSIVDEGDTAVAITVSSRLSGTHQSARIAAEEFPGKIFVVDTLQVALSGGILVTYALELLDRGLSAPEIAEELTAVREKAQLLAVVDTLEYLQRGGRVSKTVALAGGLLNVKPIIGIVDGEIKMIGKARGNKQANALMNREIEKLGVDFDKPILLGYTGTSDALLRQYMEESGGFWQGRQLPSSIVSAVIGTHAGPGAVAVAFFAK